MYVIIVGDYTCNERRECLWRSMAWDDVGFCEWMRSINWACRMMYEARMKEMIGE